MNSIDIRHFVDISIINKKNASSINSTRDTVALFTLDTKFAPADAEITTLFPTGHAIGLKTNKGAEFLFISE